MSATNEREATLEELHQLSRPPTWGWLSSTRQLQEGTYLYDYDVLRHSHTRGRRDLVNYLDWNQTAAVQELAELREEFSWKPWATDAPFFNGPRIVSEAVDILHFIGNILSVIGITDEQFWEAYRQKQEINRQRKASGTYSAQKGGLAEGSD